MKLDSYSIIARLFPGIISAIPLFVLHFFLLRPKLGEFWEELLGFKVVSDITISFVFLFAFIQLSRFVSKEIFEKRVFNNGQSLPTTDFLLYLDTYFSQEYTDKVHEKIKNDFGIKIPTLIQEKSDQLKSRKLIGEVVSHMRVRVGKGNLVGQHNAEYGFWRNLAGGSVVAFVISVINIFVFLFILYNQIAFWTSIVLACGYLLHLLFAKRLITSHGRDYAKVLIQEYMTN